LKDYKNYKVTKLQGCKDYKVTKIEKITTITITINLEIGLKIKKFG